MSTLLKKNTKYLKNANTWAYFPGEASHYLDVGSNYDFIQNTAKFTIEFDMCIEEGTGSNQAICRNVAGSNDKGFWINIVSTTMRMAVYGYDGVLGNTIFSPYFTKVFGYKIPYHIKITGDGTTIKMYWNNNLDVTTGAVSGLATGTSSYSLRFGYAYGLISYVKGWLRNLKIRDESTGSLALDLPCQDISLNFINLATGSAVTNSGVIVESLSVDKFLLNKNLWTKFGVDNVLGGSIHTIGNTTSFNWIHQTGIFRIECEVYITIPNAGNRSIFTTRIAAANNGIYTWHSTIGTGRVYCYFGSGGANLIAGSYWTAFTVSGIYKIIYIGKGTGIELFTGLNGAAPISRGTLNFSGAIVGTGNAILKAAIGGYQTTAQFQTKARYYKFYRSMDTSNLVYHFPMQDSVNFNKDILIGLAGTNKNCGVEEY